MVAAAAGLSPFAQLRAPGRLAGVDLARGLAVIGMLAAHLLVIGDLDWTDPGSWVAVAEGRSSILFALLAGVSLALSTGGIRPVGGSAVREARRRLVRRAAGVWLIGILLIVTGVPVYVILPAYAILFLAAVPLLPLGAPALAGIGGAILLTMPFAQAALDLLPFWSTDAGQVVGLLIGWAYPFPLWAGFLVLGMAVGRLELRDPRVAALLTVGGAGAALAGYGAGAFFDTGDDPHTYLQVVASALPHTGGVPEVVGGAGVAVGVLGLCLLAARTPASVVLLPLRAVGSMPLSAYSGQLLAWAIWALIALGDPGSLGAFRLLEPFWPLTIGVVAACTAWAAWLGRGPLEDALARFAAGGGPSGAGPGAGRLAR